MPPIRVIKFGGTSVGSPTRLRIAAEVIKGEHGKLVIVLSAMSGITDLLLKIVEFNQTGHDISPLVTTFANRHNEVAREVLQSPVLRDKALALIKASEGLIQGSKNHEEILAEGERAISQIFQFLLLDLGIESSYIDGTEVIAVEGITPRLDLARVDANKKIVPKLEHGPVVIPGFIGRSETGELITLGRGSTDFTAAILAHALDAQSMTIYKDVDGILTANPEFVPEARIVPELHYREARELSYYGTRVLHPRTLLPLIPLNIPLFIKSIWSPELPGTKVAHNVEAGAYPVKALSAMPDQVLLTISGTGMVGVPGIAARAFSSLASAGISVSFITQASSEASICFIVGKNEATAAKTLLERAFARELHDGAVDDITSRGDLAVVAVIGLGMKGTKGIASRVFAALAKADVNIEAIAQGSSELNISAVIEQSSVSNALKALHREFRLEKLRALSYLDTGSLSFVIHGFGQIGRTLAKQVSEQSAYFKEKMHLDLRCIALIDKSGCDAAEKGFSSEDLKSRIQLKERNGKLLSDRRETTLSSLLQLPLHRSVLIDTTAEDSYDIFLNAIHAGWHIATANKKPLAVEQDKFDHLFELASTKGVLIRYEATVGAGLPILDTLSKLKEAGDEIYEISGCFSGTLGYLMTELERGETFSTAVKKAHTLGFTEPDPRDDLSGIDVARKALILARTLGMKLNLADISQESLVPKELEAATIPHFMDALPSLDNEWRSKVKEATNSSKVLRFVARINQDNVKVGVEAVGADTPLGRLSGTDNLVTIRSKRYDKNPLVVSGPGAGADVTAAGVLNDLLALATTQTKTSHT